MHATPTRILIIGAEKGIGLGLAHEFFARGYHVTATARPGTDAGPLTAVGTAAPERLQVEQVDVLDLASVAALEERLGHRNFDVLYLNAGVWGPAHQSVLQVTPEEATSTFMTNAIAPVRLARLLAHRLPETGGILAFSTSLRGSVAENVEGGMEIYRASKAALNMLTRGLFADLHHSVLNIHPGWVNTDMGTLNGTVDYEIEVEESVRGVADVVERHWAADQRAQVFVNYRDEAIQW